MTLPGELTRDGLASRFGANVRRLRLASGVSGLALAKALGLEGQVARNAISRIEHGRLPDLHRARLLSIALGVTLDELLG